MVQESFKALKNTNINPLQPHTKLPPAMWAVFLIFTLYQRCEVRAARAVMGCKPHRQKTLKHSITLIINHF